MSIGLVGRKVGMTRVFTPEGESIPVSVVEVEPNRVARVKTLETDAYEAIQVTTGSKKASRMSKPESGHFAKCEVDAGRGLWEFRTEGSEAPAAGSELNVSLFEEGQMVDVAGTSKGKGYAGVLKRHNFAGKDATHGNSINHRTPGSIGQCQTPGRVFKGKKMTGHMGDERVTTQNLQIVRVDSDRNLLLIKGAIPGAKGGDVFVTPAVKARG